MTGSSSDHLAGSLTPFFRPRRVAVVGASREKGGIGHRVLDCLRNGGFTGSIIPVNPHVDTIDGLPAFSSLSAIPDSIDLAVITVPAHLAPSVIDECAAKLVPAVIMIAAGFAETGERGARIEQELRMKIQQHGIRLIGPNCFGLMNLDPTVRLNATYTPVFPPFGSVSIASDSGGVGAMVVMAAQRLNIGISTYVSLGNHVGVTVNDLLEYWEQDANTQVILLYLETIPDPRRFRRLTERIGRHKPIIALKAGRTTAGQAAAGSHTAALAANDRTVDALFVQCGTIRASTMEEWLALAVAFSNQRHPVGRRVGILTNSGGAGVLCADSCERAGLVISPLPPSVSATLASFLSPLAALTNPVDVIGIATEDQHAAATETLLCSDVLDALIIVHLSINVTDNDQAAAGIIRGIRAARLAGSWKPVYLCWMAEGDADRRFHVDGEVIPTYHSPEMPAFAISRILSYETWRERSAKGVFLPPAREMPHLDLPQAKAICAKALSARGPSWLATQEIQSLFATVNIPVAGRLATTADEAVAIANMIGYPVAVKLASRLIPHKTELGVVCLNITGEQAVRHTFETIQNRLAQAGKSDAMEGVLVQPMVSGGVELLIGATRDPHFGPLIAVGLGGIHVELLGDVQFGLAPLTNRDTSRMMRNLKGYPLLTGYRGGPVMDVGGLEDVLLRISCLVEAITDISQLDLNPIIVLPEGQGCRVVDARVLVQASSEH